jgi:hypothetical protein
VDEESWSRCNLTVLSIDDEGTFVLFANDHELTEFRSRLQQYSAGPQGEQKHAPYNQIFSSIAQIGEVQPDDRIGRLFRANNIATATQIEDTTDYVVDIELWDLGRRQANTDKVRELREVVEARNGRVCLAYDPPVRHTRIDYLGATMSFRLIRGKTVQEIAEAFRSRTKEEEKVDRLSSTNFDCTMNLKPNLRENSTLQKATFTMRQRPRRDYGDTYHLVVRCEGKWAGDEHSPQRYAAVVVIEHTAQVNLYAKIRARVQSAIRVRTTTTQ